MIDSAVLQLHSGQFKLREKNRFNEAKNNRAGVLAWILGIVMSILNRGKKGCLLPDVRTSNTGTGAY